MAHRFVRSLRGTLNYLALQQSKPVGNVFQSSSRTYVAEMRKSAFEGNILRLIRNEIQYELDRSPPLQPTSEFHAFKVDERPGEQWIRLSRKFGENEEIKVEVTMFDGSLPIKKTSDIATEDDVQLHITIIVDIFKGEDNDVLEFVCSAWPNSIEIRKVFTRGHNRIKIQPYTGPGFKELDDELQDSLYDFLEARGINDELAEYLHQYMKNKDKTEYIRWMETLKSFVEKNPKN
ncbi:Mitochondrial acidic MAM33 [Olea europaea subsp. europaea]|uniref:Mitochondrial acidic MAM33 n=1 Tax=Olea europaea subsp. europaea TaxID=158383 RepID=A0A8S0VJR4_OLEEU|nr:Mitochondrial acidic MAM33 [Olea europaea subsp. europaea]